MGNGNKEIKLVIITGNSIRHRYFANQLTGKFNVLGIVVEAKRPVPSSSVEEENKIIQDHFLERTTKESIYFKGNEEFILGKDRILSIPFGESNSNETFKFITDLNPDMVILYGCSIIKPPLLSYYDKKILNLHLGLSPYYRGAGTNFWPLVNREPECVGATIHVPISTVDAGPILLQVRPVMEFNDSCHDIGCKAIIAGTNRMMEGVSLYFGGKIQPELQKPGGKLYKNKDFNSEAVIKMLKNFASNMIGQYLNNKELRDKEYPIMER